MTISPDQAVELHSLRFAVEAMSRILCGEQLHAETVDALLGETIREQDRRIVGNRQRGAMTIEDARRAFAATLREALERLQQYEGE